MNPRLRLAVQLIYSNLHRNIRLEEIAEEAGLRHSRLGELFRVEVGMPPLKYHRLLRLERARELLGKTNWTVDRIRLELGYDHTRFYRDFKTRFELTPSQYRAHPDTNAPSPPQTDLVGKTASKPE